MHGLISDKTMFAFSNQNGLRFFIAYYEAAHDIGLKIKQLNKQTNKKPSPKTELVYSKAKVSLWCLAWDKKENKKQTKKKKKREIALIRSLRFG